MTDTPKKLVVDIAAGTQMYIDLTTEEIAQRAADEAAHAEQEALRQSEAEAKAQAKSSAEAKLASLGLTPEEIAALQ
jgi:hypothetical protein